MSDAVEITATKPITGTEHSILAHLLWIGAFAAATALGARIEIPHHPVPYTLQTMVVLLAGAFLGARNGAFSQLLYIVAGALGAPVFAGGGLGMATLFGPTGGYLMAFPVASLIVGYLMQQNRSLVWTLISMAVGLLVIFASGTLHLFAFYLHDAAAALTSGFLLFTWWDLLKLFAAAMSYHEIAKRWPRVGR